MLWATFDKLYSLDSDQGRENVSPYLETKQMKSDIIQNKCFWKN